MKNVKNVVNILKKRDDSRKSKKSKKPKKKRRKIPVVVRVIVVVVIVIVRITNLKVNQKIKMIIDLLEVMKVEIVVDRVTVMPQLKHKVERMPFGVLSSFLQVDVRMVPDVSTVMWNNRPPEY